METGPLLPTWAPRVKQRLIRQLYENDASGMLDEELLDQVGWGLRARCESFVTAVEAASGRARCPVCGALIPHHGQPDEVLRCRACGWECAWQRYFKTFQGKQLSGAAVVMALFQDYVARFPKARDPQEKMLLIDTLLHGFHWNLQFGSTRAACVNLIEGSYHQVIEFLDSLTYGPRSTPGLLHNWEAWRETLNQTADLWKDDRLRR